MQSDASCKLSADGTDTKGHCHFVGAVTGGNEFLAPGQAKNDLIRIGKKIPDGAGGNAFEKELSFNLHGFTFGKGCAARGISGGSAALRIT